MLKMLRKNEKGLTLVELLAVIVILAVVAMIAIPAIGNIIEKSKVDAVKADTMQVINGAELYYAQAKTNAPLITAASKKLPVDLEGYVTLSSDRLAVSHVSNTNGVIRIWGTGKAGTRTITFNGATKIEINSHDSSDKSDTKDTIGTITEKPVISR